MGGMVLCYAHFFTMDTDPRMRPWYRTLGGMASDEEALAFLQRAFHRRRHEGPGLERIAARLDAAVASGAAGVVAEMYLALTLHDVKMAYTSQDMRGGGAAG